MTFAGRIAGERAAAIVTIGREWSPDVVVRDEIDFGAAVAAERLGVSDATVLCIASGSFVPTVSFRAADCSAGSARPSRPTPSRHAPPDLVLSPFPPSFRDPAVPAAPNTHHFRSADPESLGDSEAEWLESLQPPVTYLTLGTIFNLESGDLFERVLAGLRDFPAASWSPSGATSTPQVSAHNPPTCTSAATSHEPTAAPLRPRHLPRRLGQRHRCPRPRPANGPPANGRRPATQRHPRKSPQRRGSARRHGRNGRQCAPGSQEGHRGRQLSRKRRTHPRRNTRPTPAPNTQSTRSNKSTTITNPARDARLGQCSGMSPERLPCVVVLISVWRA